MLTIHLPTGIVVLFTLIFQRADLSFFLPRNCLYICQRLLAVAAIVSGSESMALVPVEVYDNESEDLIDMILRFRLRKFIVLY